MQNGMKDKIILYEAGIINIKQGSLRLENL